MEKSAFSRRHLLASAAALGLATLSGRAFATAMLDAAELSAIPGPDDQTGALQKAFETAAAQARPLFLPPGPY
ncbi:MAG: TIGR03808 family TAT-translocated repetitive protein, partial [Devosia nanyangense]|nr:TIGR03808 family TAT-translocated repetitive protein [Devosia nanyangense]